MTISLGRQGKLRQLLGRAGPVIIQLSEDEFPSEGSARLEQKRGQMLRFSRCERHRSFGCSSLTDPWIQPINPSNRQPLDYTHPVTLCGPQSLESNTDSCPQRRGKAPSAWPGCSDEWSLAPLSDPVQLCPFHTLTLRLLARGMNSPQRISRGDLGKSLVLPGSTLLHLPLPTPALPS